VVVSAGTFDIRIFSASGEFLTGFGREGDGPGEFRGRIQWVQEVSPDTLIAFDPAPDRITYFSPAGGLHRVETLGIREGFLGARIQPRFSDGTHLGFRIASLHDRTEEMLREGVWSPEPEEVHQQRIHFLRWHDHQLDTLLMLRSKDMITVTYRGEGAPASLIANVPFAAPLLWAAGHNLFVVGFGDGEGFQVYDAEGTAISTVGGAGVPRAVTRRDRGVYRRWYLEEGGREGWRVVRELVLERTPWHDTVPLFDHIAIDEQGLIWLGEFTLQGETRTWQVLSKDGRDLARVPFSRFLDLLEIGEDYVLGRVKGEFDEEMVVRYALQRSGTPDNHWTSGLGRYRRPSTQPALASVSGRGCKTGSSSMQEMRGPVRSP
jgi:hypothetical protein